MGNSCQVRNHSKQTLRGGKVCALKTPQVDTKNTTLVDKAQLNETESSIVKIKDTQRIVPLTKKQEKHQQPNIVASSSYESCEVSIEQHMVNVGTNVCIKPIRKEGITSIFPQNKISLEGKVLCYDMEKSRLSSMDINKYIENVKKPFDSKTMEEADIKCTKMSKGNTNDESLINKKLSELKTSQIKQNNLNVSPKGTSFSSMERASLVVELSIPNVPKRIEAEKIKVIKTTLRRDSPGAETQESIGTNVLSNLMKCMNTKSSIIAHSKVLNHYEKSTVKPFVLVGKKEELVKKTTSAGDVKRSTTPGKADTVENSKSLLLQNPCKTQSSCELNFRGIQKIDISNSRQTSSSGKALTSEIKETTALPVSILQQKDPYHAASDINKCDRVKIEQHNFSILSERAREETKTDNWLVRVSEETCLTLTAPTKRYTGTDQTVKVPHNTPTQHSRMERMSGFEGKNVKMNKITQDTSCCRKFRGSKKDILLQRLAASVVKRSADGTSKSGINNRKGDIPNTVSNVIIGRKKKERSIITGENVSKRFQKSVLDSKYVKENEEYNSSKNVSLVSKSLPAGKEFSRSYQE